MGRYAMAYAQTSSFPQTVTQTPVKLGYISAYTLFDGAESEPGFNRLRVRVPGDYIVQAHVGITVDTADNFYIEIYKNGLATGYRSGVYVDTNGVGLLSVSGIFNLDVDDVIELYIFSGNAASYQVTVNSAQFSMVGI